jgi:hypothetical protein
MQITIISCYAYFQPHAPFYELDLSLSLSRSFKAGKIDSRQHA